MKFVLSYDTEKKLKEGKEKSKHIGLDKLHKLLAWLLISSCKFSNILFRNTLRSVDDICQNAIVYFVYMCIL